MSTVLPVIRTGAESASRDLLGNHAMPPHANDAAAAHKTPQSARNAAKPAALDVDETFRTIQKAREAMLSCLIEMPAALRQLQELYAEHGSGKTGTQLMIAGNSYISDSDKAAPEAMQAKSIQLARQCKDFAAIQNKDSPEWQAGRDALIAGMKDNRLNDKYILNLTEPLDAATQIRRDVATLVGRAGVRRETFLAAYEGQELGTGWPELLIGKNGVTPAQTQAIQSRLRDLSSASGLTVAQFMPLMRRLKQHRDQYNKSMEAAIKAGDNHRVGVTAARFAYGLSNVDPVAVIEDLKAEALIDTMTGLRNGHEKGNMVGVIYDQSRKQRTMLTYVQNAGLASSMRVSRTVELEVNRIRREMEEAAQRNEEPLSAGVKAEICRRHNMQPEQYDEIVNLKTKVNLQAGNEEGQDHGVTLDLIPAGLEADPYQQLVARRAMQAIAKVIAALPERNGMIIIDHLEGKTMAQSGLEHQVTESRVYQIVKQTLPKLIETLREEGEIPVPQGTTLRPDRQKRKTASPAKTGKATPSVA